MRTINLSDLENSDIKYKISNMPDGQQDIVINVVSMQLEEYEVVNLHRPSPVKIISRFNSWRDLELILATKSALTRLGIKEIHLYIPYLLGARSDRKFQEGGSSYLVDVVIPIINLQNFESVTVLDVHNLDVADRINNLKIKTNEHLVKFALEDLLKQEVYIDEYILVSPDAGASKKIEKLAKAIGYTGDIITCSKSRDTEGNLTKTVVGDIKHLAGKDFIIIDDICDGGRTFINIATAINEIIPHATIDYKIYLIVTHGIFSAGYEELKKYFDGIYCTNSVKDIGDKYYSGYKDKPTGIKQLKVI